MEDIIPNIKHRKKKSVPQCYTYTETDDLFNELVETLQAPDSIGPVNIMLLGMTGSGKSALINTLHKTLTGRYYRIAFQGKGDGKSVTLDLTRYEHCGVTVNRVSDERLRQLSSVRYNLPHIWDCAGLGNENTPKIKELLELLIAGYIRPGTSIKALEEMQETYGIGRLKKILKEPKPAWKMSKIVFVLACTNEIPKNLISCLNEILHSYDSNTWIRKYQCDVYAVFTKYDLVKKDELDSRAMNTITPEEYEKFEEEVSDCFRFGGALESHRIKWTSLTDDVGYDCLEVDRTALQFLKRMVEPGVPKTDYTDEPMIKDDIIVQVYRLLKYLEDGFCLLLKMFGHALRECFIYIRNNQDDPVVKNAVAVGAVLLIIIFFRLLTASF